MVHGVYKYMYAAIVDKVKYRSLYVDMKWEPVSGIWNKKDHRRLGRPLSRNIYKQWESPGEEQRELPVTAASGNNSSPNVTEGTAETKSKSNNTLIVHILPFKFKFLSIPYYNSV